MRTSRLTFCLGLILLLAAFGISGSGQARFPTPPEAADTQTTVRDAKPAGRTRRIDSLQIQRDARELQELAQTIPADVQHINQGLLPKDTVEKLKRIEKLSKHLRGELNP
jgi:hypothetical protein